MGWWALLRDRDTVNINTQALLPSLREDKNPKRICHRRKGKKIRFFQHQNLLLIMDGRKAESKMSHLSAHTNTASAQRPNEKEASLDSCLWFPPCCRVRLLMSLKVSLVNAFTHPATQVRRD